MDFTVLPWCCFTRQIINQQYSMAISKNYDHRLSWQLDNFDFWRSFLFIFCYTILVSGVNDKSTFHQKVGHHFYLQSSNSLQNRLCTCQVTLIMASDNKHSNHHAQTSVQVHGLQPWYCKETVWVDIRVNDLMHCSNGFGLLGRYWSATTLIIMNIFSTYNKHCSPTINHLDTHDIFIINTT